MKIELRKKVERRGKGREGGKEERKEGRKENVKMLVLGKKRKNKRRNFVIKKK